MFQDPKHFIHLTYLKSHIHPELLADLSLVNIYLPAHAAWNIFTTSYTGTATDWLFQNLCVCHIDLLNLGWLTRLVLSSLSKPFLAVFSVHKGLYADGMLQSPLPFPVYWQFPASTLSTFISRPPPLSSCCIYWGTGTCNTFKTSDGLLAHGLCHPAPKVHSRLWPNLTLPRYGKCHQSAPLTSSLEEDKKKSISLIYRHHLGWSAETIAFSHKMPLIALQRAILFN